MTDALAADINRGGLHTLEAPDAFETDGSFDLRLRNHGESTHVHLHLDDELSQVARLEAGNHYVQADSERRVRVSVADPDRWPDEPVRGQLKVVTAYGSQIHRVDVTLDTGGDEPVEVSPDLSEPARGEDSSGGPLAENPVVSAAPAVALVLVALLLALGAATPQTQGTTAVVLAVLAVVAGLLGAGYLLVR